MSQTDINTSTTTLLHLPQETDRYKHIHYNIGTFPSWDRQIITHPLLHGHISLMRQTDINTSTTTLVHFSHATDRYKHIHYSRHCAIHKVIFRQVNWAMRYNLIILVLGLEIWEQWNVRMCITCIIPVPALAYIAYQLSFIHQLIDADDWIVLFSRVVVEGHPEVCSKLTSSIHLGVLYKVNRMLMSCGCIL